MKRVVVTGLGATTPLGGDVAATWTALLAGTSGVRALTDEWAQTLPVRIAAPAAIEPSAGLRHPHRRRLGRLDQFALVAAREAWQDADAPEIDPDRLGVVVASSLGGLPSTADAVHVLREKGWSQVSPHMITNHMANGAAAWIALDVRARAGAHATVSACASGAEAIGQAMAMITADRADVVIAGGCEAAIHELTIAAFASMRALSTRNDEPEAASRPYDMGRDGFVLGEGAAMVVVESEDHAHRRGARAYAQLASVGYSADAFHMTRPDPTGAGAALAIRRALSGAGMSATQVRHVNAHATSTPTGDIAEINAIKSGLGDASGKAVLSAIKSMTGHLLGAAGALECVATVLALRDRRAPPVINLCERDQTADLDIATGQPRGLPDGPIAALSNSFGFGGHNVVLACRSL